MTDNMTGTGMWRVSSTLIKSVPQLNTSATLTMSAAAVASQRDEQIADMQNIAKK